MKLCYPYKVGSLYSRCPLCSKSQTSVSVRSSPRRADFVVKVACEPTRHAKTNFESVPCAALLRQERRYRRPRLTILNSRRTPRMPRRTHATHAVGAVGGGRATSIASLRRFCAIAASVNSNCAPAGPRRRNRPSRRMRLRCANSISIFLRSRRDCSNAFVLASPRATSRASS